MDSCLHPSSVMRHYTNATYTLLYLVHSDGRVTVSHTVNTATGRIRRYEKPTYFTTGLWSDLLPWCTPKDAATHVIVRFATV